MKKQKEDKITELLADIDSEVDMIKEEINMLMRRINNIDNKIHEMGSEL